MSTKTIENFFTGKTLVIPGYQRDYAWKERNVDDLFSDVEEALEVEGGHYLGTFILSQKDRNAPVQVVDGQQRLTTLTMLLDVLIDVVDDPAIQQHYRNTFIAHPVTGAKFRVLGENEHFFQQLLADHNPEPQSDGQDRLKRAYQWIQQRVQALVNTGGQPLIKNWLLCLSQMEVLEFIEPDEGKAIRMFQSVNDRGVPLAKMDIVKSLLVYYSNRYLGGVLDQNISQQFGQAFRSFSHTKRLAAVSGFKVRQIDRDSFREDDVLRYHYLAFDSSRFDAVAGADYSATSETVLEVFLKPALKRLRGNVDKLREFIIAYTADLTAFFMGLEQLVEATRTKRDTYLLFVVQDLSATLYPLVIRLQLMGWLSQTGVVRDPRKLHDLVELVDLRVFKLWGTNPQADIFRITQELPLRSVDEVIEVLQNFCQRFMPDAKLESRLVDQDLYRNLGLTRMLLEEEELARAALKLPPLSVEHLVAFNSTGLTVEHILPQEPNFNVVAYGFDGHEAYELHKHRIGNLILLEGPLNSACNNRTVEDKMSAPNLYLSSGLKAVSSLAAQFTGKTQGFQCVSIETRSKDLAKLVMQRWPIVQVVAEPEAKNDAALTPNAIEPLAALAA